MTAISAEHLAVDEPDLLAVGLLRTLSERLGTRQSWSFVKTLLWSTITFGVGPLLVWPVSLRKLIASEREQFVQLAEWMRLRSGNPSSGQFVSAAERIQINPVLSWAPTILAVGVGVALISVAGQAVSPFRQLLESTFQLGRTYTQLGPQVSNNVFEVWTVGLTAGYALHWLQLLIHAGHVRGAVRAFNDLAISEGLPPVREPRGVGLRPIWLAAALIMMTANAVWAIPMMLAGGMQRRYSAVTGPALRQAVADRLRELLQIRRPVIRMPIAVSLPRKCPNESCRAPMSRIANFCPRCGYHVGPEIDELA